MKLSYLIFIQIDIHSSHKSIAPPPWRGIVHELLKAIVMQHHYHWTLCVFSTYKRLSLADFTNTGKIAYKGDIPVAMATTYLLVRMEKNQIGIFMNISRKTQIFKLLYLRNQMRYWTEILNFCLSHGVACSFIGVLL